MGGAKNCPETPRQKMIGMMYLVLTAMLALNVSTDILNGFTAVDTSLHTSIEGNHNRNEMLRYRFEMANKREPEKVGAWYKKAEELHKMADELFAFVQSSKEEIFVITDGQAKFDALKAAAKEGEDITGQLEGKDNLDASGQFAAAKGEEMMKLLEKYRDHLCSLVDEGETGDKMREQIRLVYNYEPMYSEHAKETVPWLEANFEGMPSAATIALLTKIQNDIRASEGQMVQYLYDRTTAGDVVVNRMYAYVEPKSTHVSVGEKYEANILLAGIDTLSTPEYYVNGQKIPSNKYAGNYSFIASGVGEKKYNVEIHYRNNAGEPVVLKKEITYFVDDAGAAGPAKEVAITNENKEKLAASVSVSNTDVAVLYKGYTHTFRVTSSQIDASQLSMSAAGATVTPQGNGYFKVTATGAVNSTATITVYGNYKGQKSKLEEQVMTIKKLPEAKIKLAVGSTKVKNGGKIPKNKLSGGSVQLIAERPSSCVLNAPYSISSFDIEIGESTYRGSNGSSLSAAQSAAVKSCVSGESVVFTNIKTNNGSDADDFTVRIK